MRVLIAEDDPISRRVLEATLTRWGHEVIVACDGAEAWTVLQEPDAPKLAVLDWMMPEMDGLEVTRQVRELEREEYTYVLLLTARGRKTDIIAGLDAGADDYVTKPFDAGELQVRLHAADRILNLHAELLATRAALQEQATHDFLTGLWNRSATLAMLQKELTRSTREGSSVGVIVGDIDYFKTVNDSDGHHAGDMVLRKIAEVMTTTLRGCDLVGRYGGEEFLIVAPGCNTAETAQLADRLRQAVAGEAIAITPDKQISVTISLGVAALAELRDASSDELVRAADEAMYRAKAAGRNRFECAA